MKIYNGHIEANFLKAEIQFQVVLPDFCENQEFKLMEQTQDGQIYVDQFSLLLNSREAIVDTASGVASYTGSITPINVETVVIAQVLIERSQVTGFPKRKFMLEVV